MKYRSERTAKVLRTIKLRERSKYATGEVILRERDSETKKKKGHVIFGATGYSGGISVNPSIAFSWYVRSRLNAIKHPISPVKVFNPDGTLRHVLDPYTRKPITT